MRKHLAYAVSLALLVTLAGCSDDTTVPPRGDGGTSSDGSTSNDGGGGSDARSPDGGSDGPCSPACTGGNFCELPTCNAQSGGACVLRGNGVCNTIANPQCGCDGITYSNECNRRAAGVSKDHDGACACSMTPPFGCCFTASNCRTNERCVKASCTAGGAGVCIPQPGAGTCWINADCTTGTCQGATICGCAQNCLLPDMPGVCAP